LFFLPAIHPPALVVPKARPNWEAAWAYAQPQGGSALLVLEKGELVFERYKPGFDQEAPQNLMSGAKNFFALGVMAAVEDGLIKLDAPVHRYLKEWSKDPRKQKIHVRHLLQCTSGLDTAFQVLHSPDTKNKYTFAAGLNALAAPDLRFRYGSSHYSVLGELLRRVLLDQEESVEDFIKRRVLEPLGLGVETWKRDGAGNLIAYAGYRLKSKEWLRLGELILAEGRFGGEHLLGARSLRQMLHASSVNDAYGLSFWLNQAAKHPRAVEADVERWITYDVDTRDWRHACLSKAAPPDLIACIGSNGQRLYIIPSRHLVIAHVGECENFNDAQFLKAIFGR
jgi:CubicO group peptidase (beta-lactamase class C family)